MPRDIEQKKQYDKKYREENKEKIKQYGKKYHKDNPQVVIINGWKNKLGIKLRPNEDWESIYLFYITCEECENCGVELTDGKPMKSNTRCLDHDHSTGFVRNIICNACNTKRR